MLCSDCCLTVTDDIGRQWLVMPPVPASRYVLTKSTKRGLTRERRCNIMTIT